jgi:transmembrane sensor
LLSPGSELEVAIGAEERRLRLTAGEGRFTVMPDLRPFIVSADSAVVLARGTQFVVRLGETGTLVSLIEGRIEVAYPPARNGAKRQVASLSAGQRLLVPPSRSSLPAANYSGAQARPAMIEFDDARLGEAVAAMNGRNGARIRLGDPALAERRITGAFGTGDTETFADGVAAALDLEVARGADGSLWLHRRSGGAAAEQIFSGG